MLLDTNPDGSCDNLMIYGLFGSGKTTQAAEVVKHMAAESGKPGLAYVTDWGGCGPLHALANKNQLEVEKYRYGTDPFVWIDAAVQGLRFVNSKWVKADLSKFCVGVMESLTGQGDLVLKALGHQVAAGQGTDAMKAPQLVIQATDGPIKVASNSPTHYGMAQKWLLEKVWQAQLLPVPLIYTAHEDIAIPSKRDEQGNNRPEVAVAIGVQGMIGALVAGHALTIPLGKYFTYTFRIKQEPKVDGSVDHILYTTRHKDGLYEGLATNRAPLGTKTVVPNIVKPANVVQVLQKIQEAKKEAAK